MDCLRPWGNLIEASARLSFLYIICRLVCCRLIGVPIVRGVLGFSYCRDAEKANIQMKFGSQSMEPNGY